MQKLELHKATSGLWRIKEKVNNLLPPSALITSKSWVNGQLIVFLCMNIVGIPVEGPDSRNVKPRICRTPDSAEKNAARILEQRFRGFHRNVCKYQNTRRNFAEGIFIDTSLRTSNIRNLMKTEEPFFLNMYLWWYIDYIAVTLQSQINYYFVFRIYYSWRHVPANLAVFALYTTFTRTFGRVLAT